MSTGPIVDILNKYPYSFYAFGSRTKNLNQPFSDLDICYMDEIPINVLSQIRNEFEESDLPFKIDLIDYPHASENFQNLIKADLIKIK